MRKSVIKKIIVRTACIVLLVGGISCNEDTGGDSVEAYSFLEKRSPGFIKGKSYELLYDEQTWQIVRNKQRRIFCMQSDDQSMYLRMKISSVSISDAMNNSTVNAVISYKTGEKSLEIVESLKMEVLKSDDMLVWLWNEEYKVGVIMPL